MKKSRIIVLFLAVAAAGGAFLLATNSHTPQPTVVALPTAAPAATDDVLVASRDLGLGSVLIDGDLTWQEWPKNIIPTGMISKSDAPNAMTDLKGSIVRASISQSEPIRREKLIKGSTAGFMSAILPAGMRAVAINIDSQGATSAGNFVRPNDRVDVVRTSSEDVKSGSGPNYISETLLQNVLVLAIGQNIEDKNGQPTVVGSTATLQLTPLQAESVILAQRTGQLSLTLRSIQDAKQDGLITQGSKAVTVVRYGAATEDNSR